MLSGRGKRPDIGKRLPGADGRMWRVTHILWCEHTGERTCRCLVHGEGMVDFGPRATKKMPRQKFQHIKSKRSGNRR